MTTASAVHRLLASLFVCMGVLGSSLAFAQAEAADAQQRVLQQLTRGASARDAIDALRGQVSPASADSGRAADARQFDAAQLSLIEALQAHIEQGGGSLGTLQARYDAWRAACEVVRLKLAAEGDRLKQSPDGAAYVTKHEQARAKILAAFEQVRAVLDPVLMDAKAASASNLRARATEALGLLKLQRTRAKEQPILRAQAVPFGGLSLAPRQPALTPVVRPSYETPAETSPSPQDRAATSYAPLTDEIVARARALDNDYVRIYEFVRNSIRNEWYAGSVKGALGTLRSGAGNDVDQASLLTALLRAAGLNTHYVDGVVEMPLERLAAEIGVPASESAVVPNALSKAGLAFTPVVRGGRIAAVQLARTWVTAHVPYTNYRGALVDGSGKTWIPLDPFYKTVNFQASSGFFSRTFAATALASDYEARTTAQPLGDYLRQRMAASLGSSGTAGTWDSHRSASSIAPLTLDILPNSLPYVVTAVTRESGELVESQLASVRIRLHRGDRANDPVVLDKTLSLADAVNSRVTLSYGPASLEDHRLSLLYGGMDAVPLFLIGLRGELKVGGDIVASAGDRVEPGASLRLTIELRGPWGVQEVEQTVVAGAYHALVFANDPQRPAEKAASDGEYLGARLLDGLGLYYARRWNEADRDLAGWLDAGVVRPVPAVTLVSTTVRPSLLAGVPVTLQWTGVSIDAALRPVDAVGARASDFLALSALAGSSLEQAVFREQFSVEAISADRGVQIANETGVPMLSLTGANLAVLDGTNHSGAVKDAVVDLVRQGYRVRIPSTTLTVRAWTGSVWQAFKDGRAGYFISGGLAGGETVIPPELWPLGFLADAMNAMHTEEANNDPMSGASVAKIGAGDAQRGTVGQGLPTPFTVLVRDRQGRPVNGAQVTFSVIAGDATLGGGGSAVTLTTNVLGMASANVVLGRSTALNAAWIMHNEGDEFPTQVGVISVDAYVASSAGQLQPPDPFTAIALPDVLAQLRTLETPATGGAPSLTADILSLGTEDQYGNPIANVSVAVSISSTPSCPADGPPNGFRAGAVWNASVRANACPNGKVLGECGSPSVTLKSASNGAVFAGVIVSNEMAGNNIVRASATGVSRQFTYRTDGACQSSYDAVTYYGLLSISGGETDGKGNILSAALPDQTYSSPFSTTLYRSEWPYYYVTPNFIRFQPYVNWVRTTGGVSDVSVSNGGSASVSGSSFTVRTGPAPARHTSTIRADVLVTGMRNTSSGPRGFAEMLSAEGTGAVVFGVRPTITGITSRGVPAGTDPARIYLDGRGSSMYPIDVAYRVEPAEYRNTINGWIAKILEDSNWIDYAAGDSEIYVGKAVLPRSTVFQPNQHQYQAQLYTRHTVTELESDRFDMPMRQKLIANVQARGAYRYVDVENQRACERKGFLVFVLTQAARATLTYQALGANDAPLGQPQELTPPANYPQGVSEVEIDAARLGSGRFIFTVNATATADVTLTDIGTADAEMRYRLSNALPVNQVLVQGVNVRNGTLTHQTPRMGIPGRGIPFEFTSSYSSAASGEITSAGANWSHNHDLGLTINSCGDASISAGDSGSLRFFPSSDGTMRPDKGYHGTLIPNRTDNTWDFYSKDGTEYHYEFFNQRVQWKLTRVTDRNGNTQTYDYDRTAYPEPLLTRVARNDGRTLSFSYQLRPIQRPGRTDSTPRSMLVRVESNAGQQVVLDYDTLGNLTTQSVNGRTTTYTYSTSEIAIPDRYRLMTATDARGDVTQYTYLSTPLNVQGTDFTIRLDHLVVSDVQSPTGSTMHLEIDQTAWLNSVVTTNPGGTTRYTFNRYGNPLTIADPAGTTTMTWDTSTDVLMMSKTDARGTRTDYEYDTQGNQTRETVDRASTVTTYEIQTTKPYSKSRMTSRTDRNGREYFFDLDERGNVLAERRPIGTERHAYLANGDRLSTTDANGHTTRFEYDAYGNQSAIITPTGIKTETHRDPRGRIDYTVDGRQHRTTIDYDEKDNPYRQRNAKGDIRERTFDDLGNKLTERDEEGRVTTWTYFPGSLIRDITVTGPGGPAHRSFTYEGGNKRTETDWLGHTTTYGYDALNRVDRRTELRGKVTVYGYDEMGNLRSETIGQRVTNHTYDAMGRRETTTDAERHLWTNVYDFNGNLTATIDPMGRRTEMVYDGLNRLKEINQPLGRSSLYDYDDVGNKIRETDPNGNVTQYRYDDDNRLRRTIRADNTEVLYEYDDANNLFRLTDAGGGITQHTYDELNRRETTRDAERYVTTYGYDRVGNLIREAWPNGNVVDHQYDLFNRRTSTSDSVGSVGTWTYDHNGNLREETDGNGNRTTHTYDDLNFRTGTTLPGSRTLGFEPDVFGNVEAARDARGHRTVHIYDRLNRVTRSAFPDGGEVRIGYDPAGNKISQTDALLHETTYTVNALNRVTRITDPYGWQIVNSYDNVGNLRFQTNKKGVVTESRYDEMNRLRSTIKADIEIETLTYRPLGQVETRTDAKRQVTTYGYDLRGLVTSERAPEGATTLTPRNAMGDVERSTDPEGRVTVSEFDFRRRLRHVTNPANERTVYGYDLNNNKTSVTKPNGQQTIFTIDHRNMLTRVAEPMARTTIYGRDNNGNLESVTDPEGRVTSYGYDRMNRRESVTYPGTGNAVESFAHDAAGNLRQHVDANGIAIVRTYDDLNREIRKTYSASIDGLQEIVTGYDRNNNPETVTENYGAGNTRVTTTSYDDFDRPLIVRDGFGARMDYSYDLNGNRETLSTQDARITRYGYDGLNRLTGVSGPAGSVQHRYDRSGLLLEKTWSNGATTVTGYDPAQRATRILLSRVGVPLNLTEYRYDINGNRTEERVNRPASAQLTTYRYDNADRLIGTLRREGANSVDTSWLYDRADNRTQETAVTTGAGAGTVTRNYTYNARNQLLEINDSVAGVTTLNYDLQGNLIRKTQGTDITAYEWNARDLLSSVSRNGTLLGRYGSDYAGMRVSKEALNPLQPGAPPRVLRTQWDEQNAVQDRDTTGAVVARYDFADGHPVALWSAETGNQLLHADALGSVVATTGPDGTVRSETLYDAWGNPILREGSSANKFAYTGQQIDTETGLYYFKARYYDPTIGRFISVDPAEGNDELPASHHRYLYAYGNPTVYVDPDGRSATVTGAAVGFFWGFGQMIGGMADDSRNGQSRSTLQYLGVWGQNILGGALVGASFDAAKLGGPVGAIASGALGGAGMAALTLHGQGDSAGDLGQNMLKGAALGAAGGAVLYKGLPMLGQLGGAVLKKAESIGLKVPEPIKETAASVAGKVAQKANQAVEAVASRYVRTEADTAITNAGQAVTSLLTKEGAGLEASAAGTAVQRSIAAETSQASTRVAVESASLRAMAARNSSAEARAAHETINNRAAASAHVDNALVGVEWGKGIKRQGMPWEDHLAAEASRAGTRLPPNFKTFDFWDPASRVATSAKTLETISATKIANPASVYSSLKNNIRDTLRFEEATLKGVTLSREMIDRRVLEVAVPSGTTPAQWVQIRRAIEYGKSKGVEVRATVLK